MAKKTTLSDVITSLVNNDVYQSVEYSNNDHGGINVTCELVTYNDASYIEFSDSEFVGSNELVEVSTGANQYVNIIHDTELKKLYELCKIHDAKSYRAFLHYVKICNCHMSIMNSNQLARVYNPDLALVTADGKHSSDYYKGIVNSDIELYIPAEIIKALKSISADRCFLKIETRIAKIYVVLNNDKQLHISFRHDFTYDTCHKSFEYIDKFLTETRPVDIEDQFAYELIHELKGIKSSLTMLTKGANDNRYHFDAVTPEIEAEARKYAEEISNIYNTKYVFLDTKKLKHLFNEKLLKGDLRGLKLRVKMSKTNIVFDGVGVEFLISRFLV